MERRMFEDPFDHIEDDTNIATSSSSSSSCEINQFSSDDERINWKQSSNQTPTMLDLLKEDLLSNRNQQTSKAMANLIKYKTSKRDRGEIDSLYEGKVKLLNSHFDTEDVMQVVFGTTMLRKTESIESDQNSSIDTSIPTTNVGRNSRNPVIQLCSRLLECRNLIDAIEVVDQNREIIDSSTSIIREAPSFRNYDFNSYQIDHSVKESFNAEFWADREPILTTADGNCQYHAVSLSLTGTENYTPHVRLASAVAVIDNRDWFETMLQLIDRGSVLDLVHTIARNYSWGDETTLKAIAVAINRRIFLYTCNLGKKDYEVVKSLNMDELIEAFKEKKYRGGTGIHAYADPLVSVNSNNYIMLFHKSEHFIAILPKGQQLTMYEPFNPILPILT